MTPSGGARPGAGRPPGKKQDKSLGIKLPVELFNRLKVAAAAQGVKLSRYVRDILDKAAH